MHERRISMLLAKLPVYIKTMRFYTGMVDFYYPFVDGLENYCAQQRINEEIVRTVNQLIVKSRHLDLPTYISGYYEIKTNERNVLSLALTSFADFRGAHPMTYVDSLNFDVETGKNYKLYELFKPGSDYMERLSKMIEEQIQKRQIILLDVFKGIKPDQDYYIADKSLVIYFQLYEITPYYYGFPYFVIPIYDVEDIIAEDGLLERMIAF